MNKHMAGLAGLAAGFALMMVPAVSHASVQLYGGYTGSNVSFTNMQETDLNGGLYFSQPTGTADTLDFTSVAFNAGNANDSSNKADGTFQADVQGAVSGNTMRSISSIMFNVHGDYSLIAYGSPVGAHVLTTATATVTGVDGLALATPVVITQTIFNGDYNPGLTSFIQGKSWDSGDVSLALSGHGLTGAVTGVTVDLQTQLWTDSSASVTASIAQKGAKIEVVPGQAVTVVPVPAAAGGALGLLGGFLIFEFLGRSRRRRAQVVRA